MARFTRTFRSSLAATVLGLLPSSLVLTLPSDAVAESLNAKLGAWEITSTSTSSGTLIPPDVLATMPPERRAQIEASMKARSGKPQSFTTKECLTKEDLDLNRVIKEGEEEEEEGLQCTTKVISRSASKLVMERTCPAPRPSTSHSTFEAKTPESLTGNIDITRPGSGKVHVDIKGRWLGASCAGIED
jgi:Protein of unknown function (DUF3617)